MRVSRSLPVLIVFDNGPAPSVVSKEIQEGPNGGPREEERSKPVAERLVALGVPEKRCLRGIFSALGIDDHVAARRGRAGSDCTGTSGYGYEHGDEQ